MGNAFANVTRQSYDLGGGLRGGIEPSSAALFSDNFDNGAKTDSAGYTWGSAANISLSTTEALSPSYSLAFTFTGNADTSADAWAEQRLQLTAPVPEIWIKYDVFIPSNYSHRSVAPGNNKWMAIYADPYTSPGFQINASTGPAASGQSYLQWHTYDNGSERSVISEPSKLVVATADLGTWVEFVYHVKCNTAQSSADGSFAIYKNGSLLDEKTGQDIWGNNGRNYIDEMYFLGWSNSGFTDTTILYIDDVEIADSNIWGVS